MKSCHVMEEDILVKRGVDALVKKLGAVEARRFLAMAVNRREDSVKRHRNWQSKIDKNAFFDDVFANQ